MTVWQAVNSVLRVMGFIALIYMTVAVIMRLVQEWFLFHPEKLDLDFEYKFDYPFSEIYLDIDDASINGLHFKVPNSKGVVYYFKGNTRSVKGWGKFARDFLSKGYDFFMIDYRGFGKSTGKRSEENIYKDCQVGYKYLARQYNESDIVIYGRSIGSGFATSIAARNNPRLLMLDSPYYSLYHLVKDMTLGLFPTASILKYQVRTDLYIQNVKCPIYIIHGTKDRLIPYRHALLLRKRNIKNTVIVPIKNGRHNNLPKFPKYHHVIYEILHDKHGNVTLFDEIF